MKRKMVIFEMETEGQLNSLSKKSCVHNTSHDILCNLSL